MKVTQGGLAHPSDEARCELLASLQGRGWAKQLENGTWQATRTCLQKMCATHVMHSPSAFGDIPADLPLSDMSSFQLCVRMQNMGWRWGKFRPAKTGPYVLGGPQYWHTSGKTVLREYLLSLLQAEQVLAVEDAEGGLGNQRCILHCRTKRYYELLLQGQYGEAVLCLQDKAKSKHATPGIEDVAVAPMLADEGVCWQPIAIGAEQAERGADTAKKRGIKRGRRSVAVDNEDSGSESGVSSLMSLLDSDDPGQWENSLDELSGSDGAASAVQPVAKKNTRDVAAHDDVCEPSSSSSKPVGASDSWGRVCEPSSSSSSRAVPFSVSLGEVRRAIQPQTIAAWGLPRFRITYRPSKEHDKGATPAAWQGICPFHKKSANTKCTKAVSFSGGPEEAEKALCVVKNWLVHNPRFADALPSDVLEEQANALPEPPDTLVPDDEARAEGRPSAKSKVVAKSSSSD